MDEPPDNVNESSTHDENINGAVGNATESDTCDQKPQETAEVATRHEGISYDDTDDLEKEIDELLEAESCGAKEVSSALNNPERFEDDLECLAEEDKDILAPNSKDSYPDLFHPAVPDVLLEPSADQDSSCSEEKDGVESDELVFGPGFHNDDEDADKIEADNLSEEPYEPECDINSDTEADTKEQVEDCVHYAESAAQGLVQADSLHNESDEANSKLYCDVSIPSALGNQKCNSFNSTIPRHVNHADKFDRLECTEAERTNGSDDAESVQHSAAVPAKPQATKSSSFEGSLKNSVDSSSDSQKVASVDIASSVQNSFKEQSHSPQTASTDAVESHQNNESFQHQNSTQNVMCRSSDPVCVETEQAIKSDCTYSNQEAQCIDDNCLPADVGMMTSQLATPDCDENHTENLPNNENDLSLKSDDAELDSPVRIINKIDSGNPNGIVNQQISLMHIPEYISLVEQCEILKRQLDEQEHIIKGQEDQANHLAVEVQTVSNERDTLKKKYEAAVGKSTEEIYLAQVKEMESTIAQQTKELQSTKEKLNSHDVAAKRAIAVLQNDAKKRVDEITKLYEDTKKEKEDMVMKYAMAEQKSIEAVDKMAKNDMRMREIAKEREIMIQRFTQLKKNREGAMAALEARSKETVSLKREVEMLKETVQTHEMKTKWANNKLKAEFDNHKETKGKLEELQKKLNEQREEALILRKDCQAMIKTYQESEEVKSVALDQELKQKECELMLKDAENKEVQQYPAEETDVHSMLKKELDSLKTKHKDMLAELKTYKDKAQCLETERRHQEHSLSAFKETLQKQKSHSEQLKTRLDELEMIEQDFLSIKEELEKVKVYNADLEVNSKDLQGELDSCISREQEHLEFTQKISETNSRLQSENNLLSTKVKGLSAENERLSTVHSTLDKKTKDLEADLAKMKSQSKEEIGKLTSQFEEKCKAAKELAIQLEDERDEIKTLKKKHTANTKDLTRQLQQAKRKLEAQESKEGGSETKSMGSRTSSNTSLETMNNHQAAVSKNSSEPPTPEVDEYPTVRVIEVDKQMLIEKIVRLQKTHARKSEKIEFLEDHINQLLQEVKKKTKIIQNYALREEAGTLSPDTMDANKAAIAKRTGIMASLYSSHQQDGTMTLELSLEINRKLQAVLEDTILKNITLKDNIETLGQEIARLSQENRQTQLEIQALHKS